MEAIWNEGIQDMYIHIFYGHSLPPLIETCFPGKTKKIKKKGQKMNFEEKKFCVSLSRDSFS